MTSQRTLLTTQGIVSRSHSPLPLGIIFILSGVWVSGLFLPWSAGVEREAGDLAILSFHSGNDR